MAFDNSAAPLLSMPNNLLLPIIDSLSVEDVQTLMKSVGLDEGNDYADVLAECRLRLSVENHIKKITGRGIELLELMSRHGVYISGSASLEFFVRGSMTSRSDVDFYIGGHSVNVCSFMIAASKMGFEWSRPITKVEQVAESGGTVFIYYSEFMSLRSKGYLDEVAKTYSRDIDYDFTDGMTSHVLVYLENNCLTFKCHDADYYNIHKCIRVLNGCLWNNDHVVNVQLIHEERDTFGVVAPLMFHSTCVQSFISPHISAHLYGKITARRHSYKWPQNITGVSEDELRKTGDTPYWVKYRARGYEYIDNNYSNTYSKSRCVNQNDSTIVLNNYNTRAPPSVVAVYRSIALSTTWLEMCDSTRVVDMPSFKIARLVQVHPLDRTIDSVHTEAQTWIIPYEHQVYDEHMSKYGM